MEAAAKEKVEVIVRSTLEECFADEFIFDPIVVIPEIDEYGDDYLDTIIVFDGAQANLCLADCSRICWQVAFRVTAVARRGVKPTALCNTQPRATDVVETLSTAFLLIYGISPNYSFICRLSGTERTTTLAPHSANPMLSMI